MKVTVVFHIKLCHCQSAVTHSTNNGKAEQLVFIEKMKMCFTLFQLYLREKYFFLMFISINSLFYRPFSPTDPPPFQATEEYWEMCFSEEETFKYKTRE